MLHKILIPQLSHGNSRETRMLAERHEEAGHGTPVGELNKTMVHEEVSKQSLVNRLHNNH